MMKLIHSCPSRSPLPRGFSVHPVASLRAVLIVRFLICALSLIPLGRDALAETASQFRPALLGQHARSLVNIIDTQGLMKRGQGDGFVMFGCAVSEGGYGYWSRTYRASANTELLQKEVLGRIDQGCSNRLSTRAVTWRFT